MLTVRKAQHEALAAITRNSFTERMVLHVKKHFKIITAELGDESTRQAVEEAWKLANTYHFETEYGVCQFINLVFSFGDTFESTLWAAPILLQGNYPNEQARADRLHAAALRSLGK